MSIHERGGTFLQGNHPNSTSFTIIWPEEGKVIATSSLIYEPNTSRTIVQMPQCILCSSDTVIYRLAIGVDDQTLDGVIGNGTVSVSWIRVLCKAVTNFLLALGV